MNLENILTNLDKRIKIVKLRSHSKASEHYVDVVITGENGFIWNGSIPYYYRRTGLFIENEQELTEYLNRIIENFTKDKIEEFVNSEKLRWETEMSGKEKTKGFFDILLNLKWNSVEKDLPTNPNWARRIQDIKEFGYTLSTNTNMNSNGTHIILVPIPKGGVSGYEIMSVSFKKKVINALNSINAFELSSNGSYHLIPDHKFPEIRWDKDTKESNEMLGENEIKLKFQLLDNQRNLQKREVCRKCFQTDKRGVIFGIDFFYEGNENWPSNIPKIGKDAERGCVGCAWYDIQIWRKSLNKLLLKIK